MKEPKETIFRNLYIGDYFFPREAEHVGDVFLRISDEFDKEGNLCNAVIVRGCDNIGRMYSFPDSEVVTMLRVSWVYDSIEERDARLNEEVEALANEGYFVA